MILIHTSNKLESKRLRFILDNLDNKIIVFKHNINAKIVPFGKLLYFDL